MPDKNQLSAVVIDVTSESFRQLGHGHDTGDDCASAIKQRDHKDATDLIVSPFVKARRAQTADDFETWVDGEVSPTLNAFDNAHETRATVLFTAQRVGEPARMYDDASPTLQARMGTGGNNTPMVAQPIAFSVREDATANTFSATETDTALAVTALQPSVQSHHAQLFIVDAQPIAFSHTQGLDPQASEEVFPTLRSEGGGHAVMTEYLVRRLTPLECERLMGWPDDHTRWRADGTEQPDTQRYKQCGNGVATPVAAWIAQKIVEVL